MIVQPVWAAVNCCCRSASIDAVETDSVSVVKGCPHCHVSRSEADLDADRSVVKKSGLSRLIAGRLPCEPDRCPRCACDQDLQSAIVADAVAPSEPIALPALDNESRDWVAVVAAACRRSGPPAPVRDGRQHCILLDRWLI